MLTIVGRDPHWALLALAVTLALAALAAARHLPWVSRPACLAAAVFLFGAVAFGSPFPFSVLTPLLPPRASSSPSGPGLP